MGKGQGHREQNFWCVGQMSTIIFSCCVEQKHKVQVKGASSPEAETAFGRLMEATNLIFRNAKSHRCLCCLARMTFNRRKSNLTMRMVTIIGIMLPEFISIRIFPGRATLPPLAPFMHQCWSLESLNKLIG